MKHCTFALIIVLLLLAIPVHAQLASRTGEAPPASSAPTHRTRLILKDGSYQVVTGYTVVGDRVRYTSAERGGEEEEIPLNLVDLPATKRWEQEHTLDADGNRQAPALDPELLQEEAERAQLNPEVAPDLRLPSEDGVLSLDTWRGNPELVPLAQTAGDLNRLTGHSVLRGPMNPLASTHPLVVIKGEKADVQLHVERPVFYIRLDDDQPSSGAALTVDTHGASAAASHDSHPAQPDDYVITRTDVRQDARVIPSFNTTLLDTGRPQDNIFETDATVLPGGHWLKLTPREDLLIGEYALVEVLGVKSANTAVWDFGVHPTSPENRDVLLPEPKKRPTLTPRR
jgi:hypothetical protein